MNDSIIEYSSIHIQKCKTIFDLFDKDKDGFILKEDLLNVMRAIGLSPIKAEIEEMLENTEEIKPECIEELKTNKVSFVLFLDLCQTQKEKESKINKKEVLEDIFKLIYKGEFNTIKIDELKRLIQDNLDEDISEEDANQLIKNFDTQNNFDDFYKKFEVNEDNESYN